MGTTQFEEISALSKGLVLNAASGTSAQEFFTFSPRQHRVDAIYATNTDSIDHVVRLYQNNGGTVTLLGSKKVLAGQGTADTPAIEILSVILAGTVGGIVMDLDTELKASVEVAVTGANEVNLTLQGGYV